MTYPIQSFPIEVCCLPSSFGHPRHSRTALWKPTFGPSTTLSKMIRPGSYRWLSLRITTIRMRALAIRLSSWTVDTTSRCFMKKTSTLALSPKITSTMPKNFKNGPTIKTSNLETMLLMIKFGWTANISRLNKTGSWRQSFLHHSKSSI